jgi:hypothetical protein
MIFELVLPMAWLRSYARLRLEIIARSSGEQDSPRDAEGLKGTRKSS